MRNGTERITEEIISNGCNYIVTVNTKDSDPFPGLTRFDLSSYEQIVSIQHSVPFLQIRDSNTAMVTKSR